MPEQKPGNNAPHLEYEVYTFSKDSVKINATSPLLLNFHNTEEGLQYAISIDDEAPQIISLNKEDKNSISGIWNKWVGENIIIKTSKHFITIPGKHTVKYWMVNPWSNITKTGIGFWRAATRYFGPPETINNKK